MSEELLHLIRHDSYGCVQETLHFWLEECSLDEIPSNDEIAHWQQILQQRGGKFAQLAEQCRLWLDEQHAAQ